MTSLYDWALSVKKQVIWLSICTTVPSMLLYLAQIVTIIRHKKFHNSFYALFTIRAIANLLFVLDSFYLRRLPSVMGSLLYPIYAQFPNWMIAISLFLAGTLQSNELATVFILLHRITAITVPVKYERVWRKFLPFVAIVVFGVPSLLCLPTLQMKGIILMDNPNSTTDLNFALYEAGDAPYVKYMTNINTVFSIIFMIVCGLLNIVAFIAYKFRKKSKTNTTTHGAKIERNLLIYALATFIGHLLMASLYLTALSTGIAGNAKFMAMLYNFYPFIMDTGTVAMSSWLLLWASSEFRQRLIKDFEFIRFTRRNTNNRSNALQEANRNNNIYNHFTNGGTTTFSRHQLATVS